jgi:DNA-binding response OmpR family regulator
MSARLLLVEDDTSLGYMLSEYLELKGFDVSWKTNAEDALDIAMSAGLDLCILDVSLPGEDGFSLARKIKEKRPSLPFIFLTARSMKPDILKGFKHGADDYITKPVDEEELVARLQAILRRTEVKKQSRNQVVLGKFIFDMNKQELSMDDQRIPLTKKETQLLQLFTNQPNELVPTDRILTELWGRNDFFNRRSMDVFISRLRKKLQTDPGIQIENVHGKGFILRDS